LAKKPMPQAYYTLLVPLAAYSNNLASGEAYFSIRRWQRLPR